MPIFGWDASNHDWGRGPMDLGAAVRDGISFFTHKATEGTGYRDPYLGRAIQRARDAGMPFYGAYFVPRTGTPVRSQVDYFLRYLDEAVPGWRTDPRFRILQVDTEHWQVDTVPAAIGAQACDLLRPLGKYVVHYAPAWAYGNSIPGPDPLWASAYGANPAVPYRQAYPGDRAWPAPYSGRRPAIWQFGSRVRIGTQSTCDINAIRDPAVWATLTGGDDEMDPKLEAALQAAFVGPYNTTGDARIGPQGWVPLALERPLREVSEKVDALAEDLAELAARPAPGTVVVTDEQLERVLRRVMGSVDGSSPTS